VNAHTIGPGKITFGKTQIMYGIQQIGFAYAIATANTNDTFCEIKLLMVIVFELKN